MSKNKGSNKLNTYPASIKVSNKLNSRPAGIELTQHIQTLRLALEEAWRTHRHIDNSFWVISSFLMIGTGFAVAKAIEWDGKDWRILILAVFMIMVWFWYLQYLKDTLMKILFYINIINNLESELKIDLLPSNMEEFRNLSNTNDFFQFVLKLKFIKASTFSLIMTNLIILSWLIWLGFIAQFLVLENVSETCEILADAGFMIIIFLLNILS